MPVSVTTKNATHYFVTNKCNTIVFDSRVMAITHSDDYAMLSLWIMVIITRLLNNIFLVTLLLVKIIFPLSING